MTVFHKLWSLKFRLAFFATLPILTRFPFAYGRNIETNHTENNESAAAHAQYLDRKKFCSKRIR
ncbi:MAG: hypothetical protein LBN39_02865 [Planctomycetaceae bacterium]|jgi:hypothetical protein|nr:hypothetical protein [Planctomycetaceae bacterium]